MLLEKGKQAVEAYKEAVEKQDLLERLIKAHKQEITILRDELQASEEKSQSLSQLLIESEATIEKLTGVTQHYQQYFQSKRSDHTPDHEALVEEMKEVFEERQCALEREK